MKERVIVIVGIFAVTLCIIALAGCGKDHPQGYGSGKTEQQRYCADNHWTYESKTNSCKR